MRILLTGSEGGVGSALLPALESDKHVVVGLPKDLRWSVATPYVFQHSGGRDPLNVLIHTIGRRKAGEGYGWELFPANVQSTIEVTDVALRAGAKTIILFSGAGYGGKLDGKEEPAYVASKAAVVAYAEAMALAHRDVCFHAVAPGNVRSIMNPTGGSPDAIVKLVRWLLETPRKGLSGCLLSAKRDNYQDLEVVCRLAGNSHVPGFISPCDEVFRMRRVLPPEIRWEGEPVEATGYRYPPGGTTESATFTEVDVPCAPPKAKRRRRGPVRSK